MSGVKGSQSCFPSLRGWKRSGNSDLSQPLPSGVFSWLPCALTFSTSAPPEDFPTVEAGSGDRGTLVPMEGRKGGSFRYQRGAGSRADPELALCLGSLMLSRVWLSCVSTPGCGPLSGWPCQPGVLWSLQKPQQDVQNGISFCPCSLSLTHTPSVNSVSSAQWSLEWRIHRRLFYLVPSSRALCF